MQDFRYSSRELEDAFSDLIVSRCGLPLADPHPLVQELRRADGAELCHAVTGLPPGAPMAELSRALTSSDFGNSLATGLNKIVSIAYGRASKAYAPMLLDLPSRGLHPVQVPVFDLGELKEQPKAGGSPFALAKIVTGETVQPKIWAARFLISRNLLISDGIQVAGAAVAQLAGHAAALEPRLIGAIVVANANLSDAAPLIAAGNTTAGTGLDITALGQAMAIIRNSTTPAGNISNATPMFLMVPPAKEAVARVLVSSLTYGAMPAALTVLANPWSGADSYLVADPLDMPVFARVYPSGMSPAPSVERILSSQRQPDGALEYFDGQAFQFEQFLGVSAVGRGGIVRIPAA